MAKTKTPGPIDEITIDVQATVWKFDLARGYPGYPGYSDADGAATATTWYDAEPYVMVLMPEAGRKRRTMACFYEEEQRGEWVADLIEDNGGADAVLCLPWDVFCRCVERLGALGTGSAVAIPGRNGTFVTDGTDAFYTTACRAHYKLSLAALEALAQ